jgi:hypothetical protein
VDYLLQRTRLQYGYREILHYLTNCRCIRKKLKKDIEPFSTDHMHMLYTKGNEKLERELDIINLVKSIRQLRLMAHVLLGPNERMLLKF